MSVTALCSQRHLLATLFQTRQAIFVCFIDAMRTRHTLTIVSRAQIFAAERPAACMALHVPTFGQIAIYGDARIEDKALSLPTVFVGGDFTQVAIWPRT